MIAMLLSLPHMLLSADRAAPREGDRDSTTALLQRSAKNMLMKKCSLGDATQLAALAT